jgi:hypothetical protein
MPSIYPSSLSNALEHLRAYMAELLEMERIDPRQGVDMAPDPTYGGAYIGVRWGGVQVVEGSGERTTSEPYERDGLTLVKETLEAPRARLRVFVDVHDGQEEMGHLEHLSELLKTHPPRSRVDIGEGYELLTETLEPSTQGNTYNTVATGWLYFDLSEQSETVEGPTLHGITVQVRQNPQLEEPTTEQFVIGEA